ncbi:MAG: hypothetical protein ACXWJZ_07595, partial [Burkholderiaceae bacterium]
MRAIFKSSAPAAAVPTNMLMVRVVKAKHLRIILFSPIEILESTLPLLSWTTLFIQEKKAVPFAG